MINQIGGFEEIGEKIQDTAQSATKSAQQGAKNFANSTKSQITGNQSAPQVPASDQGSNEAGNAAQKQMSDDQAKQFLKDLYGPTKPQGGDSSGKSAQQNSNQNVVQQAVGLAPSDPNAGKSPEEIAKMMALRKILHVEYYEDLTKKPTASEESVVERNEREDQEKQLAEIENEKDKPTALVNPTIKQGTGENVVGVSG